MKLTSHALYILIIILLSVALWIQWDHSNLPEDSRTAFSLDSAHQVSTRQIRLSDSIALAQINLRERLEAETAQRTEALTATVNRQARSIATFKALRDTQGITPDTLSQAIEVTQDSTIRAQAKEIEALHVDGEAAKKSFQIEIKAIEDKFKVVVGESDLKDVFIVELQKQVVKERKRGKIFQYLFYGAVIYGAVKTFD